MAVLKAAEQQKDHRKRFLVGRVQEHGPTGFGYRGFSYSQRGENAPPAHNRVTAFLVGKSQLQGQGKEPAGESVSSEHEMHPDSYIIPKKTAAESLTGGGGRGRQALLAREAEAVARKKRTAEENALLKVKSPSRGRAMQALFQDELQGILEKEVATVGNGFKKNVGKKLREHNREHGYKNGYKYPKDIIVDPLQWLNDDIDTTIKFQDQKIKKEIKYF